MTTITGTDSADVITGTAGDDVISGLAGNDTIHGSDGNDQINGGDGDDTLYGDAGDDVLYGGAGNDSLSGGDGNDMLYAGPGYSLVGGPIIDGGAGVDTLSFSQETGGVTVRLYYTGTNASTLNIENLEGSDYGDALSGNDGPNVISGGGGDDGISGGGGDDILTGGDGNDAFSYYAGGGKDVITDLTDDLVDLNGYVPQSITQVGTDVLMVFSSADQITFRNTTIATVQAAISGGVVASFTQPASEIIPALPDRPGAANTSYSAVLAGTVATVASGSTYYGVNIDYGSAPRGQYYNPGTGSPLILGADATGTLKNAGTIWDSSTTSDALAVSFYHVANEGTIVSEVGPYIPYGGSSPEYLFARAVSVYGGVYEPATSPIFTNTGKIYAIATAGGAIAVSTSSVGDFLTNAGLIAAQATFGADHSSSGGAQGVLMFNPAHFINEASGQILVDGDSLAYGIKMGRGSHPAADEGPEIVNRGLIHVTVSDEALRPAVGIFAINMPTELMRIENSGTIEADIAIYAPSSSMDTWTSSDLINPQTVTNDVSGLIIGAIQLELGNDTLINAGTIRGTVDMGGNDDIVDNTAGIIDGTVILGDGNDTFTGGASVDHVRGGTGNDTIAGAAGADLIEGDFGDDRLDGGPGNDGLYGSVGNDLLITSGGDVAHGGYGDDVIQTTDLAFAQIDGGPGDDRWVLPAAALNLDLSQVAASQRVSNIEEIDLQSGQSIVIRPDDLFAISGTDSLHMGGDSSNTVYLAGGWTRSGDVTEGGVAYAVYTSGTAAVFVQSDTNVSTGSPPVAGGLDPVAAGDAAPQPDSDADTNVMAVSNFVVLQDLVITADEIWRGVNGAGVINFGSYAGAGGPPVFPNVTNYGEIINETSYAGITSAVGGSTWEGSPNFGTFSNSGDIYSSNQDANGSAMAFVAGSMGKLVNTGNVVAETYGAGDSTAILTADTDIGISSVINGETGYIESYSAQGYATGLVSVNDAQFQNDGLIQVEGYTGAVAIDEYNAGGYVINTGEIDAWIAPGGSGVSIGYVSAGTGSLTNSGIISADISVYFVMASVGTFTIKNSGEMDGDIIFGLDYDTSAYGRFNLTNSGVINGSIMLDPGLKTTDVLTNTGTIVGSITFAAGNDSYDGSHGSLKGFVDGGAGNDTLIGGSENNLFIGGDGGDILTGNAGNDTLDGGAGADTMSGGTGDDTYIVDNSNDISTELAGEGTDTVQASVSYTLGANLENVILTGTAAIDGTGNGVANAISGNDAANRLSGSDGNDVLVGNGGNDTLDGGAGADTMVGGTGDDTYCVDSAHDVIAENAAQGTDMVRSSINYTLGANIENLALDGTSSLYGYGNEADNALTGNAGANKLFALAGNDTLDGGAGDDRLVGGTGDDTYYVDSYNDHIIENVGEGTDRVYSSANYKLSANIETLRLTGSADLYGYGNELDNVLTGNGATNKLFGMDGNDQIDGKGGADRMFGGTGDDRYYVDNYSDRTIENAGDGTDAVFASVDYKLAANIEKLTLTGTADLWAYGNDGDNVLTGNSGANKLYGMTGNDRLDGGAGNDWLEGGAGQDGLTGGTGADQFVFRDGDFAGANAANADRITDFTHGEDHIRLNFVDADSSIDGDQAFAFLGSAAFDNHAGELRYEQISGNTYVEGDTNGDGVADFMIRVDGLHTLVSGDFVF